jgi:hypothetical protein
LDRRKPECQQVDLDCQDCIRYAARNLAVVSEDLSSTQSRALFLVLFPADECRSMASEFTRLVCRLQTDMPVRHPPAFALVPMIEAVA